MSYYFAIIGTKDNPIFEYEFGSSKGGGDGIARFKDGARHMNQFIIHSSLDVVEEVQWGSAQMYLKHIDRFNNNYISCFLTAGNIKFLLLTFPNPDNPRSSGTSMTSIRNSAYPSSSAYNPTAPAAEEAIKNFFMEVYDTWVKNIMNPFYFLNQPVKSPVFRARIAAAAKKYL